MAHALDDVPARQRRYGRRKRSGSLFYQSAGSATQDIQNGWWVIKKYNCMGCHQLQVGQRSVVMDLPFYQTPEGKDLLPPR
jgi:hypothetical protein